VEKTLVLPVVFPDGFRFGATTKRGTVEPDTQAAHRGLNKDAEQGNDTDRLHKNSVD
jgi:hypothetical protein